jgi:hypothetical protein
MAYNGKVFRRRRMMVALPISEQLAQRLETAARRRNLSIEEYLEGVVEQEVTTSPAQKENDEEKGTPAHFAEIMASAGFRSGETENGAFNNVTAEQEQNNLAQRGWRLAEMNYHSGETDVSERSREILETEYAEYLLKRHARTQGDA